MSENKKEFRIMLKIKSKPDTGITFTSFIVPADMEYPKAKLEKAVEDFMKTDTGLGIVLDKKGKFKYPVEEWGIDLQSEHERYLVEKHFGHRN